MALLAAVLASLARNERPAGDPAPLALAAAGEHERGNGEIAIVDSPQRGRPVVVYGGRHDTSAPLSRAAPAQVAMPSPIVNFDGLSQSDNVAARGIRSWPPDTNGEVGAGHYVQMVQVLMAAYTKAGALVPGFPKLHAAIWSAFTGPCATSERGDPVVVYDQLAGRWLVTKYAWTNDSGPFYQCMAVSTTSDPAGSYHRYEFLYDNVLFNDYPKFAVWPNAYFMTVNQFDCTNPACPPPGAGGVVAFERAKMLAGQAVTPVMFKNGVNGASVSFGLLPADLDGSTPPPASSPGFFLRVGDDNRGPDPLDRLQLYRFTVDFANPGAATFTGPVDIPVTSFTSVFCGNPSALCIQQPGTNQRLDQLSTRLMFRLAYRNFGTHRSLVVNHTINVGGDRAGIRWYELRNPEGTPVLSQEGTYAPADTLNRWAGSIAQDRQGNAALGFSTANATAPGGYPSVRYVGRLAGDASGAMPQGETTLWAGNGSQTGDARWGDYSDLTVDPLDDCTFWYTQEYYAATSIEGVDWRTRIGSFRFPSCSPPTAVRMLGFVARAEPGRVILVWRTTSERDLLGFHVWRGSHRLTKRLVAAGRALRGAAYRLVDGAVRGRSSYSYRLQAVGAGGSRAWVSAITVSTS